LGLLTPVMRVMHKPIYDSRKRALVAGIVPHLRPADRVLDVGCGNGSLGQAILASPSCPKGVTVEGLERVKRGGEPIPVHAYDGGAFPFPDHSYDVVIVADVLHHEPDPEGLLARCRAASRRLVIIKDHQVRGFMAQQRIGLIDWAANAPYGVPCLYRYNTPAQWSQVIGRNRLEVVEELASMKLYPPVVDTIFGGSLHYFAVLKASD